MQGEWEILNSRPGETDETFGSTIAKKQKRITQESHQATVMSYCTDKQGEDNG